MARPHTDRSTPHRTLLPGRLMLPAAILAASLAAYGATIGYPYVQDAVPAVEHNPVVERGSLREIFAGDYWAETGSSARTLYRPVTLLSFAAERGLTGRADPRVSHLLNVLLHAAVAWLLTRVGAGWGAPAAGAVAGLLFAVHPLLLQAVASVVGRADILAALFSLAALRTLAGETRVAPWLAAAWLFLALGSKEVALATPLLMVAQALAQARGRWLARLAPCAPSALAMVLYLALRTHAIEAFPGLQPLTREDNVLVGLSGGVRIVTVLAMSGRYALLSLLPLRLSADYSGSTITVERSIFAPLPLAGLAWSVLLIVAISAPLWRRKDHPAAPAPARAISLAALLFAAPYLVIGNVLVLNAAGFAERLLYVSTLGTCLMAGLALTTLARWVAGRFPWLGRRTALAALAIAIATGAAATHHQARMWASLERLYEHALRSTPRSLLAHFGLAELRRQQGRTEDALRLYRQAVQDSPESGDVLWGLGSLLRERGDLPGAEHALRRAVAADPSLPRAHFQLGLVLRDRGRIDEAERALRRTLRLNPRFDRAEEALADLVFADGRYAEAAALYRACVRRGRNDVRARLAAAEQRAAESGF